MNQNEINEMITRIEAADNWNDIEPEEYEALCEALGLNYHDYDDPDKLFADIKKAANATYYVTTTRERRDVIDEFVELKTTDRPERNNQDNQNDHRETSGTGLNLQQINNPFTFIQNGDNNTQIGYIANQTIVKK